MNDSQEPSYYEIALTNRQVLVFFVVLLLSVVGAFFSGVWLGQQRSDELPAIARMPALQEDEPDSEALAELDFFNDEEGAAASSGAGERGRAGSTAERDPSPAPESQGEPVAAAGDPDTTLFEDVSGSPPPPSPSETTRTPAGETSPVATPAGRPASGGYVIQVFSSPDGAQAQKLVERLEAGGFEAFLSSVEVDGRTTHRVRLGPYAARSEADAKAVEVAEAFRVDTWVTAND